MSNTHQKCETCRFFSDQDSTAEDDHGSCLRYPPQIESFPPQIEALETAISRSWLFPRIHKNSRCGEWRPILESGNISAYDEEFTKD